MEVSLKTIEVSLKIVEIREKTVKTLRKDSLNFYMTYTDIDRHIYG